MNPLIYQEILLIDNLISVDDLSAKAIRRLESCLLVNNNSCGKLILSSELPIIFDDNLKTNSASFFIAYFNLLRCRFDSFTFKLLHCIIL